MVEKLLVLFRQQHPDTLIVKVQSYRITLLDEVSAFLPTSSALQLDGSDVVLAEDAGGHSFRARWEALGKGIIFTAEVWERRHSHLSF